MDSVWFVFLFLPCVILLNFILPSKFRSIILTLSSILYLAFLDLYMLPLLLVFVLTDYLVGILIDNSKVIFTKNILLVLSVLFNVFVFVFSQYTATFPTILGVSVISLVKISYLADIRSGKSGAEKNIFSYLSAVLCFPCLHYGPILNISNVTYMIKSGKETLTNFGSGASLFIYGLFKKVILSDMLLAMLDTIYPSTNTVVGAWVWIVFKILAFYYLLLGYAQMAQGVCRMLGFKISQNFSFPFMSCSVTSFFRRFNMGLAEFVRKYIYIPMGGNRRGVVSLICAITVSSLVTTLWYGFSFNHLIAAFLFALVIVIEKTLLTGRKSPIFKALDTILSYLCLFFGFTLFLTGSLSEAAVILESAFGIHAVALFDNRVLSCVSSYLPILLVSIILLFDFSKKAYRAIQRRKSVFLNILFVLYNLTVLFICTAYIV